MTSSSPVNAPVREDELLRGIIKPGHHVVCVGTFAHPGSDPSALYAGFLVHPQGRLTIVDSKSYTLVERTEKRISKFQDAGRKVPARLTALKKLQVAGMQAGGFGDPMLYHKAIALLSEAGAKLSAPQILISDARKLGMREESADVIIDRGSLAFIHEIEKDEGKLGGTVRNYLRALKPGGKLVLILHDPASIKPPDMRPGDRDEDLRFVHEALPKILKGESVLRVPITTAFDFDPFLHEVNPRFLDFNPWFLKSGPLQATHQSTYKYDYALVVTKKKGK